MFALTKETTQAQMGTQQIMCNVCSTIEKPQWVHKSLMRSHIARHLLAKEDMLADLPCGWCGIKSQGQPNEADNEDKCTIMPGKGDSHVSVCCRSAKEELRYSLVPALKSHKKNPSTNVVVPCPEEYCSHYVWMYNLKEHYEGHHQTTCWDDVKDKFIGFKTGKDRKKVLTNKEGVALQVKYEPSDAERHLVTRFDKVSA